jgi:hypothetical protein
VQALRRAIEAQDDVVRLAIPLNHELGAGHAGRHVAGHERAVFERFQRQPAAREVRTGHEPACVVGVATDAEKRVERQGRCGGGIVSARPRESKTEWAYHDSMIVPARGRWLPQFSLRQLLLATTFVAIGCYALRWASPWWSIVLFYAGLLLIVAGILIAINRTGETRSFWAGFAICGILHMLLVFRPGLENGIPALHPGAFVTTWASAYTYTLIKPQLTVVPIPTDPAMLGTIRGRWGGEYRDIPVQPPDPFGRPGGPYRDIPSATAPSFHSGEDGYFRGFGPGPFYIQEEDFVQVAHGLWTLLLAYLGGHISLAIYRRQPQQEAAADEHR